MTAAECGTATPFGSPVEPEVKVMYAGSADAVRSIDSPATPAVRSSASDGVGEPVGVVIEALVNRKTRYAIAKRTASSGEMSTLAKPATP